MATEEKSQRATVSIGAKARRVIADSWQSRANLSFFLALLVLFSFVLPVLGFAGKDTKLYADVAFSLLLISGVAIGWGQRWLVLVAGFVGSACIAVRWMDFLLPARLCSSGPMRGPSPPFW